MDDEPPWIEKAVKLAGSLGMNQVRVRWKLRRWHDKRQQAKRRREQWVEHVKYEHKTCGACGAVADRDATQCGSCGAKLGRREFQVLSRIGLGIPGVQSASTLLAVAILAAYARVWVAQGGGFGSPGGPLLVDFGGRWWPYIHDEPWRLLTAVFLHAGIWHLVFNLVAIGSIGPRIEEIYGRGVTLFVFVATGVLANLGSGMLSDLGVGIGASGGIMGLIGLAAGYGQRAHTAAGRTLRNDMLKWTAYTLVFGFAVGADNWAHLLGGVTGAAFGYFARPAIVRWGWVRRGAALLGGGATIAALIIIFTRHASPPVDAVAAGAPTVRDVQTMILEPISKSCQAMDKGDAATARAELARGLGRDVTDDEVRQQCDVYRQARRMCREEPPTDDDGRQACAAIEAALAEIPDR